MDAISPDALKRVSSALATTAETLSAWMEHNKPHAREGREVRACLRAAQAIDHTADAPQTIAVYGASQAGKSFLTGALTSPETGPLIIDFSTDHQLDFLREINPPGGKESSGLVSRFTVTPPSLPTNVGADTPICVKLLSARDVVCILGNTYFRDFKLTEDAVKTTDILETIKNIIPREKNDPQQDPFFTKNDVEALQDYFNSSFLSEKSYTPFSSDGTDNEYWAFLAENISSFDLDTAIKALSPLWGGPNSPFTDYAHKLLKARFSLDRDELAFCNPDALNAPNNGSILNVETLWGPGASMNTALKSPSGKLVGMGRDVAAALISELILPLKAARWEFQKKRIDLLDFPGARSRGEYPSLSKATNIPELFLRGKVDYLFHLYKSNNDLTSVLLCIGDSNQEVVSLPAMIDGWVNTTIGATPEERSTQDNSLFIILTKFDTALASTPGRPDDGVERWDTRLDASIINYFKNSPWLNAWEPAQPIFNNIQWLRSPTYGDTIYDRDAQKNETTMLPGFKSRLPSLKTGYDSSAKVRTYIRNHDKAFDAVLKPNDGGVSYLAERLLPLAEKDIKTSKLYLKLRRILQNLQETGKKFYFDNSQEAVHAEAERSVDNFIRATCLPLAQKGRFGVLLQQLSLSAELVTREWIAFNKTKPQTTHQEIQLLESLLSPSPAEKNVSADAAPEEDDFDRFAAHILKYWEDHCREKFSSDNMSTERERNWLHVNNDAFSPFLAQLFKLAETNNLAGDIANILRNTCKNVSKLVQNGEKPGILTAETISNFVTWLGYPPVDRKDAPANRPVRKETGMPIFLLPEDPAGKLYPDLPNIGNSGVLFLLDWVTALKARFREAGPQYDVEENAKLGQYLETLSRLDNAHDNEKDINR
ncbi:hypothetical protein GM609_00360 [Bombella sp. ESL0387]|nr:hypothetical protein [Bombella sp. ESL0387]